MRVAASLLALALVAAAPVHRPAPRSSPKPAAARDWTRVAVRLPSGHFRVGNPAAKVRLVEYLSLTCPHCGHMAETAVPQLMRDYVRTGKVSYEVRVASRDPADLAAISLARCAGPRAFFPLIAELYHRQQEWVTKGYAWLQSAPPADGEKPADALRKVAAGAGLDAFFAGHGMSAAAQAACFAGPEPGAVAKLAAATWQPGFPGTPTFEVNGVRAGVLGDWSSLRAKLVAAGA